MQRAIAGAVAALIIGAGSAAAQDACSRHVREPDVGGWSSYQMFEKEKPKGTLRFAIVGREERGSSTLNRFEMTISDEKGKEQMTMQVLVPGWPYEGGAIEGMVMQPAGREPMLVGGPMLGMMKSQATKSGGPAKDCDRMQFVGNESVTVPGGTFQAARYRDAESGAEVWATSDVPFGFVKTQDGKGNTMLLTDHGADAKSAITGTPRPMGG
ncbi:MAG: hypothetical protein M3Y31_00960 [Gemmatimonadota bacterium]|nr:hypothetical protein [Gemmatimonadota bacterium]